VPQPTSTTQAKTKLKCITNTPLKIRRINLEIYTHKPSNSHSTREESKSASMKEEMKDFTK